MVLSAGNFHEHAMRRKLSAFRLPVDFGNESVCPVPIEHQLANGVPRYIVQNGKLELRSCSPRIAYPLQRSCRGEAFERSRVNTSTLQRSKGFTLVEILVVLVLLSLIVFALMAVFSGIQRAFRASLTQTDTLEGGRAVMDMMANDLATMTPSDGDTNPAVVGFDGPTPVNFFISERAFPSQYPPTPLFQPLMSSPSGAMRSNILENIFMLSKGNINGVPSWIGTGYSVNTNLADGTLYPLYRFYMTTNAAAGPAGPTGLFNQWVLYNYTNSSEWSHLMDGVVNLTAQAYDTNGILMTNGYANPGVLHVRFVRFNPDLYGVTDAVFYSNAVPASVQIEMGTLEDQALRRAEAMTGLNQSNYLSNDIGQVHLFRQRVWIRNVDPTAYQ
jgi:prepilin-type N-terminal cleavage/methylation domain-containing protein